MGQLEKEEQQELLILARSVLEIKLFGYSNLKPKLDFPVFQKKKGAFVTLHKNARLRGCIGIVEALYPLIEVIQKMAVSAGFRDPRFQPLTEEEYSDIDLEISVLSEAWEINNITEIEIGKHGLMIRHNDKKGLLLPQVAIENNWDIETFLNHTCIKASLPKDQWKNQAHIQIFEAEVFGER